MAYPQFDVRDRERIKEAIRLQSAAGRNYSGAQGARPSKEKLKRNFVMTTCTCLLGRDPCDCEHSADLIDRLNNVKTDVNDYFVIVDAVNAITTLRTKLKELSEDIGLQRDDAWDEGYACGRDQGPRLDDRGSNLDGN